MDENERNIYRQIPSFVKDTADFIEKIKTMTIEDDEIMVSFDIKSLFTSVPIADATNVIKQLIQKDEDFSTRTNLKPESLLDLLQLCLTTTSFQFRETHYELTDGLPMGSPTSPSVANLFVAQVEKRATRPP